MRKGLVVIAAFFCSVSATAPVHAEAGGGIEKTTKRAVKFTEKTVTRAAKFTEKTAKRAGKFVERTATKVDRSVRNALD